MLDSIGPAIDHGPTKRLDKVPKWWVEILDTTATQMAVNFQRQPEVEAELRNILGRLYFALEKFDRAEAMFRGSLEIRRRIFRSPHPELVKTLYVEGKWKECFAPLRESLAMSRTLYGNESPSAANALSILGSAYYASSDSASAEPYWREALSICRKILAPNHPSVAESLEDLGWVPLWSDSREAESLFREALAIRRQSGTLDQLSVRRSPLEGIAMCRMRAGDFNEAERLARESIDIDNRVPDCYPMILGYSYTVLGGIYSAQGNFAAALPAWRRALDCFRHIDSTALVWGVIDSEYNVAICLVNLGDPGSAEPLFRDAIDAWRNGFGDQFYFTLRARNGLAAALVALGKYTEAETLLDGVWRVLETVDIPNGPKEIQPETIQGKIDLYTAWAKTDPSKAPLAEQWRKRVGSPEKSPGASP